MVCGLSTTTTLSEMHSSTVLDSSLGKPAKGVEIGLLKYRSISSPDTPGAPEVFAFDPIAHGYEPIVYRYLFCL